MEKIVKKSDGYYYEYEGKLRKVTSKKVEIKYLKDGKNLVRIFEYNLIYVRVAWRRPTRRRDRAPRALRRARADIARAAAPHL